MTAKFNRLNFLKKFLRTDFKVVATFSKVKWIMALRKRPTGKSIWINVSGDVGRQIENLKLELLLNFKMNVKI